MLQNSINEYNEAFTVMSDLGMRLYLERTRSQDLIIHVENLINSIAKHPKSFDVQIEKIQLLRKEFEKVSDFAKQELEVAKKSAIGVGSGVAAGSAVASIAPTAAMWIATTFGTASTGTAISSLSGAAATNAALAWLGGGMFAGTAFLALAGPIGWGITGLTIFSSVVFLAKEKLKTKKEKNEEIQKIKKNTELIRQSSLKIESFIRKSEAIRLKLNTQYSSSLSCFGKSFVEISEDNQMALGTLVNNAMSLAITMTETL